MLRVSVVASASGADADAVPLQGQVRVIGRPSVRDHLEAEDAGVEVRRCIEVVGEDLAAKDRRHGRHLPKSHPRSPIAARMLLLGGSDSPSFMTTTLFEQLATVIANSTSEIIDGLDHLAPDRKTPDVVAEHVLRHLQPL